MSDKIQNSEIEQEKMSPFDYFTEVVGWLQIVASPLLFGLIIGACVYLFDPTTLRLLFGISNALVGLIIEIVFATIVWKSKAQCIFFQE